MRQMPAEAVSQSPRWPQGFGTKRPLILGQIALLVVLSSVLSSLTVAQELSL